MANNFRFGILLVLVFILFSTTSFSQTKKTENSIDTALSKCLKKDPISTAEMCECTIKAAESWDKELNKYYNLLKAKLPKDAFASLKESQIQWLKYRDKEFAFIDKYYYEVQQGTMWYPIAESTKKEIIKKRALELMYYSNETAYF